MHIKIQQKAISVDHQFSIAIDGKKRFHARGFGFGPVISYSLYKRDEPILSIKKVWFRIPHRFSIYFHQPEMDLPAPLTFDTVSYFKNSFVCHFQGDEYRVYVHVKSRYSVFKNGVQVAGMDQARWTSFKEDEFRMECNRGECVELMVAFTIILDHLYNHKVQFLSGLFTFNVGVIGEEMPFAEDWVAK